MAMFFIVSIGYLVDLYLQSSFLFTLLASCFVISELLPWALNSIAEHYYRKSGKAEAFAAAEARLDELERLEQDDRTNEENSL